MNNNSQDLPDGFQLIPWSQRNDEPVQAPLGPGQQRVTGRVQLRIERIRGPDEAPRRRRRSHRSVNNSNSISGDWPHQLTYNANDGYEVSDNYNNGASGEDREDITLTDSDEESTEDEEGNVVEFLVNFDRNLNGGEEQMEIEFPYFLNAIRRITDGLSAGVMSKRDTLPYPKPPSSTTDLFPANMPCHGYITMNRGTLNEPFSNCLVDKVPTELSETKYIFLSSYCKDCWIGLSEEDTQAKLRASDSKIFCTPGTSAMLQLHYPVLYYEILNILTAVEPNKTHEIVIDEKNKLLVHPVSVEDVFPGSCMYLFITKNTNLLHTGMHAHQENTAKNIAQIKTIVSDLDILYVDTALFYPRKNSCKKDLYSRTDSLHEIVVFIKAKLSDLDIDYFLSVRFRAGMEDFISGVIAKLFHWNSAIRFCVTNDVYEACYVQLQPYRGIINVVEYLDSRYLSEDTAHLFFYSEESSEYTDIHKINENHLHLRIIYDMHTVMKPVNSNFCSTMYVKCREGLHGEELDEKEKNQFFALYPSHPTNKQVLHLITELMPEIILGLATPPGVGVLEMNTELESLCYDYITDDDIMDN